MNFLKLSSNIPKLSYQCMRTFAKGGGARSGLKKGDQADAGYGGSRGKLGITVTHEENGATREENHDNKRTRTKGNRHRRN